MSKLEGQYAPTPMQSIMGVPLRSEQRTGEILPRVLSRVDMLVVFITIVLFIPNVSVAQATGVGSATYVYWVIGTITFLLPGAIVTGQLNRFMPVDGSIYVWTHKALGPLWGFFAGFCAWFPVILAMLAGCDTVLSLVQGTGIQLFGAGTGWIATLPLRLIMRIAKVVIPLYGLGIFVVGLAGVAWLLNGHAPQPALTTGQPGFGQQGFVLYGVIVLALLGVEVPLNMAAETKETQAAKLFLRRGPRLVFSAYLLGTFGVMAVVPREGAGLTYSTLTAVRIVFGVPLSVLVALTFISFFFFVAIIYNVTFARILFVSALDHRMPPALAKVNRHAVPYLATTTQTVIVIVIAVQIYFIAPMIYRVTAATFSTEIYDICEATTTVIWCISMIILFFDLPILLRRFRAFLVKRREQLIAPTWVLYLCCAVGGAASLLAIWTTLTQSWASNPILNGSWFQIVGCATLASLGIGFIGAAYPRLLSNLDQQTAAARENARMYSELSAAYAKLSEMDQLKDAFLNTASHELRTPLTIVQGYLELLGEMEDLSPELRRSFLNNARRACDELVLLQANIMDASRVEFDAATLQRVSIPLKETCTVVVDLFEPLILQQQRQVEVDIPADLMVLADETRLKQILRNLIANALRYSPHKTPICITARQEQDLVRVNVIDRGPGIPPDKHKVIFEKFVRLERDRLGITGGSGLGLFITRQLVEAMKGSITVESSGIEGEGAIFSFTLPVAQAGT